MTPAQAMQRINTLLAHAWMVRNFLKHADEVQDDEEMLDGGGFAVFVKKADSDLLDGATVDYVERVNESGFEVRPARVRRPGSKGAPTGPIADRVRNVLETQVNPAIAAHGGFIQLLRQARMLRLEQAADVLARLHDRGAGRLSLVDGDADAGAQRQQRHHQRNCEGGMLHQLPPAAPNIGCASGNFHLPPSNSARGRYRRTT